MRAQRCQILFLLYPVISSNYIDRKRSLSGCTRTHMHHIHFVYAFMGIWVVPPFGYGEQWCCEHGCASICSSGCFQLFWVQSWMWNCSILWYSTFTFLRNRHTACFPRWPHHFANPPAIHKSSNVSTSSSTLVVCIFYYSHLSGYKVVYHYDFDLQCTNDFEYFFIYFFAIQIASLVKN